MSDLSPERTIPAPSDGHLSMTSADAGVMVKKSPFFHFFIRLSLVQLILFHITLYVDKIKFFRPLVFL
ncbi:MAG: hypothetical protein Q7S72_01330, partial [Candidatus Taylorbacteria bacterium]|nr:hypothetical protein [Candidatus Taylorbacteria bacterium]